jgi:hypothetical protein
MACYLWRPDGFHRSFPRPRDERWDGRDQIAEAPESDAHYGRRVLGPADARPSVRWEARLDG